MMVLILSGREGILVMPFESGGRSDKLGNRYEFPIG